MLMQQTCKRWEIIWLQKNRNKSETEQLMQPLQQQALLLQSWNNDIKDFAESRDLQFPNLEDARLRLLFTLIFKYKMSTHHMEGRPRINIRKIKRKIKKKQNSRENKSTLLKKKIYRTIWIQILSFFTCLFIYSLIETMYSITEILLLVFLSEVMN